MYCDEATVRLLVKNRKSVLDLSEIQAMAAVVDPEIDSVVSTRYYWPSDSEGQPIATVPPLVRAIANYLTAALIEGESTAFATGAEGEQHPWGVRLDRIGRRLLARLQSGEDPVLELTPFRPGRVAAATPRLNTVSGFSGRSGSRSAYRRDRGRHECP